MNPDRKFLFGLALSGSIGLASSSRAPFAIAATAFAPVPWIIQRSRSKAFAVAAVYYAGAVWPIIPAVRNFLGPRAGLTEGIGLSTIAVILLASPWLWLWTADSRQLLWRTPVGILLTVVPPLGLIGWASPLLGAGYLFPGTRWLGLALVLTLPATLIRFPRVSAGFLLTSLSLSHALYPGDPVPPTDWEAINTNFGGVAHGETNFLRDYQIAQQIQARALASQAHVIVFPESVITNWTDATEMFWNQTLTALCASGKIILVGATSPLAPPVRLVSNPRPQVDFAGELAMLRSPAAALPRPRLLEPDQPRYRNAILVRGAQSGLFLQRVPVPIGMWKPLSHAGVPLNLTGPGVIRIANQKAAVLICYEQVLTWPVLTSMLQHSTILIAIANDYWVNGTPAPGYQAAAVKSWARLFDLPVICAANS
jgi:predicted amidohydrolase